MALRMTENHTELSFRYMRIEGRKEKLLDFLLRGLGLRFGDAL